MPKAISILAHKHLRITNEGESEGKKTAKIVIDGPIGGSWWWEEPNEDAVLTKERMRKELQTITDLKADVIIVEIDSLGGDVGHAISMHDLLKKHPAHIVTDAVGLVASAATIMMQAGDERKMSANGLGLIHRASMMAWGNVEAMETAAKDLKKFDDRLINIYMKRSGKDAEVFAEQMDQNGGQGVWSSPEEFQDMGLVDDVYEPVKAVASAYKRPDNVVLAMAGLPSFEKKKTISNDDGKILLNQITNMDKTDKATRKNVVLDTKKLNELLARPVNELTDEDKTFIKDQQSAISQINNAISDRIQNEEIPENAFEVGDKVKVIAGKEHMPEHAGKIGEVKEVKGETCSVLFEGEDDPHKWYMFDELEAADEMEMEAATSAKVSNDELKKIKAELESLKAKNSALESKVNKKQAGPINIVNSGDPTIDGEAKPLTKNQRAAAKNAAALMGNDDDDADEIAAPEKDSKKK